MVGAVSCTAGAPSENADESGAGGTSAPGDGDGDTGNGDGDIFGDGDIVVGTGGQKDDIDLSMQPTPASCGDAVLDENEACDDGNLNSGDGCFENCLIVERGFICPTPGAACIPFAKCGDGQTNFPEQCDDANSVAGDGCSAFCKTEIGFKCSGSPSTCTNTTCGDMLLEGAEGCDDGNSIPFDGCDAKCQWEPTCGEPGSSAGCSSFCGDGILFDDEACDDGNSVSGDGCSAECEEEEGYACEVAECEMVGGVCVLRVPVVYRDFLDAHENFACGGSLQTGLVGEALVAGKPVYTGMSGQACLSDASNMESWYIDSTDHPTIVSEIVLYDIGGNTFVNRFGENGEQYENSLGEFFDGTPLFFPIDDLPFCGLGESLNCILEDTRHPGQIPGEDTNNVDTYEPSWIFETPEVLHNFSFTTEVSYFLKWDEAAPPNLDFLGDDDFWVFVNGKLVLDLGAPHVPAQAQITLDAATSDALGLGLVSGTVYPITVFHAERNPTGSSFRLTLSGFRPERSSCIPNCGDGIVAGSEECDDGDNDGGHNECQPGCVLSTYCGDGVVSDDEQCDDADPDAPSGCSGCRIITVL